MHLPPALQQELSRRRLTAAHARAQGGSGERASRAKGSGSEFADFRPYQPGDDIRSLDARVIGSRTSWMCDARTAANCRS